MFVFEGYPDAHVYSPPCQGVTSCARPCGIHRSEDAALRLPYKMSGMKIARSVTALRALCGLGLHAEVLVPAVLEALHSVVPSHRNLFDWTDTQGRLVRYFIEGPIDAKLAQLYFDEFHNRREAEAMPRFDALHRMPAGIRGASELDHAGFYNSDLYNAIWRPQGFKTRLEAVLRGRGGELLGSLVLYRAPGDPRFGVDEERCLASVLPAFADGLQACGPAVVQDQHVPSRDPPESLLLTLQGQVCHASPGAHRLLLMAAGGASRETLSRPLNTLTGDLLPMLMARLRERACQGRAALLAPPPSITHETPAGQFVASGELLRPLQGTAAPLAHITLRRLEPHRVALERALRALPITAGQMAVCREMYRGASQVEIGARLGVAAATVVDHVRKIYDAVNVRSSLELRVALDAQVVLA